MIVIVCVDDQYGMMFRQRRVSQDAAVRADIRKEVQQKALWMNTYSSGQFQQEISEGLQVKIDEEFLNLAGSEEYCLLESTGLCAPDDPQAILPKVEQMIIYHWNRRYPSDLQLDFIPSEHGWKQIQHAEFTGTSHEKITKEVYER